MRAIVLLASEVGWYNRPDVGAKAIGKTVFDHPVTTLGLVLIIHLDGSDMNTPFSFTADLLDADGRPVIGANGEACTLRGKDFTATPTGDLPAGSPANLVLPVTAKNLALEPGQRYEWRVTINGEARDDWVASFYVRP